MDLLENENFFIARSRYLGLWGDFDERSRMPMPHVEQYGNKYILRADLAPAGLKAFGAEKLVAEAKSDILVYVAPRVGHAPDAIAALAQMYGKRCVFFCPASKEISRHQRALLAYPNVELRFARIAAMPVLNKYAREWADRFGASFLPFGLTKTPVVTAGLVNMCANVSAQLARDPTAIICAVSTGTMIRALQIGWPRALAYGIAVARNMHKGEIGQACVLSHKKPFLQDEDLDRRPPFPSTSNYDAKAWSTFTGLDIPGSIFINVGSDDHIERNLELVENVQVDSARKWGDLRDLEMGPKWRKNS